MTKKLIWDNVIVPMRRARAKNLISKGSRAKLNQGIKRKSATRVTRETTERIVKIIDSKYEKANVERISQSTHKLDAK